MSVSVLPSRPPPPHGVSSLRTPSLRTRAPDAGAFPVWWIVCALLAATAAPVRAQGPPTFSVEIRGGWAVPTGALEAGTGPFPAAAEDIAFGARFDLRRASWNALFAGFSQLRYACEACPGEAPFISTGWEVGARLVLPVSAVEPWVGVAAVFHRVEASLPEVDEGLRSDLGAGWEASVGLDVPLGGRMRLRPQLRALSFDATFPGRGDLAVRHWTGELGVLVGF